MRTKLKVSTRWFIIIFFLLITTGSISAIHYQDGETIPLRNQPMLFTTGDHSSYSHPFLDDSTWDKITIPYDWKTDYPEYDGISWIRFKVFFPDPLPVEAPVLLFGQILETDQLYLNGSLVGKNGNYRFQTDHGYTLQRFYPIPGQFIKPGEINVFAFRIDNAGADWGGPLNGQFFIGPSSMIYEKHTKSNNLNLIFILIYLIVGISFIFFFVRIPSDQNFLIFGIFCIILSFYNFTFSPSRFYFIYHYYFWSTIQYITINAIMAGFIFFVLTYFKIKMRLYFKAYFIISLIVFMIQLFTRQPDFLRFINQYFILPVMCINMIIFIIILIRLFKKNQDAPKFLVALLIFFIGVTNDILITIGVQFFMYHSIMLSNYFFLGLVLVIAMIVATNSMKRIQQISFLNQKLTGQYKQIQDLMNEKNRFYYKMSDSLRNPLNIIMGQVQFLLLDGIQIERSSGLMDILENIHQDKNPPVHNNWNKLTDISLSLLNQLKKHDLLNVSIIQLVKSHPDFNNNRIYADILDQIELMLKTTHNHYIENLELISEAGISLTSTIDQIINESAKNDDLEDLNKDTE